LLAVEWEQLGFVEAHIHVHAVNEGRLADECLVAAQLAARRMGAARGSPHGRGSRLAAWARLATRALTKRLATFGTEVRPAEASK
jgi:hypothetical protein